MATPFFIPSRQILFWNAGKRQLNPMWGGDTITIPPVNEAYSPEETKRHFYSCKGPEGYVPGTLVIEDRIEFNPELGRNVVVFRADEWLRGFAEHHEIYFKRGLRLLASVDEIEKHRAKATEEYFAHELEEAVKFLASERRRRKNHERLGEDVPPMSPEYERQLSEAQACVLAAQVRQKSTVKTEDLEAALRKFHGLDASSVQRQADAATVETVDAKVLVKRAQELGVYVKKDILERIFLHEDQSAVAEVAALVRAEEEKQTAGEA